MRIFILLPAYNEEQALRPLVEKVKQVRDEMQVDILIVVINDGSQDQTEEISRELGKQFPIDVVTHKYNRGLGETARDGFEYIAEKSSPDDIIIRMDCDDTHDPKYIPELIKNIQDGYEVVIASRYAPGGGQMGVDWYRRIISRVANLLLKIFFPISGVKEYTCGYRAYRAAFIQDAIEIFGNRFIDLKGMGFTGTVEKMVKCKLMGARVGEIPFVLRYDQKMSTSKVVTSITTLGYFMVIAKNIFPWGDLGREWKEKIDERKKRMYMSNGTLRSLRRNSP